MPERLKMSDFAAPTGLAVCGLTLVGWLTFVSDAGAPNAPTALVFPLNWTSETALGASVASGADVIAQGPLANIVIVAPRDAGALDRAFDAGAVVALNANFAALCGVEV